MSDGQGARAYLTARGLPPRNLGRQSASQRCRSRPRDPRVQPGGVVERFPNTCPPRPLRLRGRARRAPRRRCSSVELFLASRLSVLSLRTIRPLTTVLLEFSRVPTLKGGHPSRLQCSILVFPRSGDSRIPGRLTPAVKLRFGLGSRSGRPLLGRSSGPRQRQADRKGRVLLAAAVAASRLEAPLTGDGMLPSPCRMTQQSMGYGGRATTTNRITDHSHRPHCQGGYRC